MIINDQINTSYCPCGTRQYYLDCCGKFISGEKTPSTPEELMRSRYTAYSQANIDYIVRTMKYRAADNFNADESTLWAKSVTWSHLEIVRTNQDANKGFVEFIAYYYQDGKKYILHELSEFHCEEGKWYYVDGTYPDKKGAQDSMKKIGRNDSCPCGSKKKYKKCCGNAS